jgi:secretion/DNA translocation related TadE-like protein
VNTRLAAPGGFRGSRAEGSATIWVLLAMSMVLAALLVVLAMDAAVSARERAQTAADLAALGAAAALHGGSQHACARAAPIAAANRAVLTGCQISGDTLLVRTAASMPPVLTGVGVGPALASSSASAR